MRQVMKLAPSRGIDFCMEKWDFTLVNFAPQRQNAERLRYWAQNIRVKQIIATWFRKQLVDKSDRNASSQFFMCQM